MRCLCDLPGGYLFPLDEDSLNGTGRCRTQYVLTLQGIKRRQGADSADAAVYAVIHSELRQPRETRILGQLVRSDSDPHEHVVYKGETFKIGRALYRVNWVSEAETAIAAGVLRHPDSVTSPLKFEYE